MRREMAGRPAPSGEKLGRRVAGCPLYPATCQGEMTFQPDKNGPQRLEIKEIVELPVPPQNQQLCFTLP